MIWLLKTIQTLIVIFSIALIVMPEKIFIWHEELKPKNWRSENLNVEQIKLFIGTMRVGGAFGLIAGLFLLIFVNSPN